LGVSTVSWKCFFGVLTVSDCNFLADYVTFWLTTSNRIGSIKLKNLCGSVLCENRFSKDFPLHIFKTWAFACKLVKKASYHLVEMACFINPGQVCIPFHVNTMFAFSFREVY